MLQPHLRLRPELVPKPLWGKSAANLLNRADWEVIRQSELKKGGHRCAACSSTGPVLFCHEQWRYDDERKTATLIGFEIHCKTCDLVTHMGKASADGKWDLAVAQFCKVNEATSDQAEKAYYDARAVWQQRNRTTWTLEIAAEILQRYPKLSLLYS